MDNKKMIGYNSIYETLKGLVRTVCENSINQCDNFLNNSGSIVYACIEFI